MNKQIFIIKSDIDNISRELKQKSFSLLTHQYLRPLGKLKPVADSCGQLGTFGYCDNLPYESEQDQKDILKVLQFRLNIPYEIKIMNLKGKNRFILYIEEYVNMLIFSDPEIVDKLKENNILTVEDLIKRYLDPSDNIQKNFPFLVPIMYLLWNDIDKDPKLIDELPVEFINIMNSYRNNLLI